MKQKELSFWLKCVIAGVAVCGLIIYAVLIPRLADYCVTQGTLASGDSLVWMISVWVSALPCYAVLVLAWRIAVNIGENRSFSIANAKLLKWISYLTLADVVYFFAVNVCFLLMDKTPAIMMGVALVICFFGTAFSVCAAALSHLVVKAAAIEEENELTV
jgi:hypothetical protein